MYREGHELYLTTQNIAEFWNVCTRPVDVNGLGLSIEGADRYTAQLERFFGILPDSMPAFHLWRKLVVDHARFTTPALWRSWERPKFNAS